MVGRLLDSVTKKSKIKILAEIPLAFPLHSWFSAEKWRKNIFQSIDFRENHSASPEVNFGDNYGYGLTSIFSGESKKIGFKVFAYI